MPAYAFPSLPIFMPGEGNEISRSGVVVGTTAKNLEIHYWREVRMSGLNFVPVKFYNF